MYNKMSQSIMDYLMLVIKDFPSSLKNRINVKNVDPVAKKLYSIWSDSSNKIIARKIKIPLDMPESDIIKLERSGLIQVQGSDLKITSKGELIIRKMILDDDSFALKKSGSNKIVKLANKNKNDWYTRISNEDFIS